MIESKYIMVCHNFFWTLTYNVTQKQSLSRLYLLIRTKALTEKAAPRCIAIKPLVCRKYLFICKFIIVSYMCNFF